MNKNEKRILDEDIKDLERLIIIYAKSDNDYKVAECEKELKELKNKKKTIKAN